MDVETLFTQINASYRGTDDDPPAEDTTDWNLWLNTANRKKNEWARDGKNHWQSMFDIHEIGTVASGLQAYDLDDEILIPADEVLVTTTDDQDIYFQISKPEERRRFYRSCYISGLNPQILTFYDTISSTSQIVGGTIKVSGYYIPDDMESSSDTVPIDDPYWLVYAVASELAFNDLTYEDKYQDLNIKANNLYSIMANNNRRGTNNNPRVARTNVKRIPGTSDERKTV